MPCPGGPSRSSASGAAHLLIHSLLGAAEMTTAPTMTDTEHPPVCCLLQLNYDGSLSILARRGCTDADVAELLAAFVAGVGTLAGDQGQHQQ